MYKWYASINTLPIKKFFLVLEKNDYRYLIKDIDYDNLPDITFSLKEEWDKIYEDYLIESNNPSYKGIFEKQKQIHNLMIKHEELRCALFAANFRESEKISKILKANNVEKLEDGKYKLKGIETKIKIKLKELELKNEKSQKQNYDKLIGAIEDMKGFQIDTEKTTVKQFISYTEQLKDKIRDARRKNRKK